MLFCTLTRDTTQSKPWAIALLVLMIALMSKTTVAQSPTQSPESFLRELLPVPQPSNTTSAQQKVIPFAQPADAQKIVVEEKGAGLISLKVRDASLKQVVTMIAETQRFNIVFAAPEDIRITSSLEQVPWQQALESLLSASGHTWTMDHGIMVITTLQAAESIAPRAGGRRVETFELDFAKAVDIDQTVKGLLSPSGKSWVTESSSVDNRQSREVIAVVDFPGNLQQIADYICQVDQAPRQVLIKANILQVDLRDDCRSGVNLQQLVSFSGNQVDLFSVGFANAASPSASFLRLNGGSLDGLVETLKTTTDAKTLASTELLAISGQEARLQSGQQLGFRVTTTTQTSTLESVEFIDVGVVLTMTPHVTRDGRVLMHIKPEVSEGQVNPETGLPAEDTVEVETDVLLNNGQGLVIGGLIQEIDTNVQNKIPWLGDIPYAGVLFQRRQLIKSRAEIIVTLIPHIMPYSPIVSNRDAHRVMRTEQPLLSAPLNRFPRPYEAQLPDTFTNPRPICIGRHCQPVQMASQPVRLPQLAPLPAINTPSQEQQGPLCYPPTTDQQASPVLQQAARSKPATR